MESEDVVGTAFLYLFSWVVLVFVAASTWHLWNYLEGDESHATIKAKVAYTATASLCGAFMGFFLAAFLLLIGGVIDYVFEITYVGLLDTIGSTGMLVVFFASAQASACMWMLKDDSRWTDFLSKEEKKYRGIGD